MKQNLFKYIKNNYTFLLFSAFFLFALLNPIFKKYDYGAGFPLVVGFCVCMIPLFYSEIKKKKEISKAEFSFLGFFAVMIIISFIFSKTRNIGFSEVLAYLSVVPVYYFLAFRKVSWTKSFFKVVSYGLIISAFIGAFFYYFEPEMRLFGPFFNIWDHSNVWPNAYALFILMAWPLFLLNYFKNWKWWNSLALGLIAATFVLTFSRGAIIAFAGQFVLLVLFNLKRINKKVLLHTFLVILAGIVLFFGINELRATRHATIDIQERATFQEGTTSTDERLDFWIASIDLIQESPLYGHGPFSWRYAYNPMQKTFLGNSDHNHNWFLKIAVENGLIAASAFVFFLFTVFITFLRRFRSLKKEEKAITLILGVSIAGAVAHSIIDYNFNFYVNLLLFFVILALFRSYLVNEKKMKTEKSEIFNYFVFLLILVAIYEGIVFSMLQLDVEKASSMSLYPRNYNVDKAMEYYQEGDHEKALVFAERAVSLNKIDAETHYVKGLIQCDKSASTNDSVKCMRDLENAVRLNPLNDIKYYREYMRNYYKLMPVDLQLKSDQKEVLDVLEIYMGYVKNNIHYTAYSNNVEAAEELVNILIPHMTDEEAEDLIQKSNEMLEAAEFYRSKKTY